MVLFARGKHICRARILATLLAIAALAAGLAHAEIFRWTDQAGRVHYSDNPPDQGKTSKVKIRVQSITGPATVTATNAPRQAPTSGMKDKVKLYTTAWCGYCKRAKAYLAQRGIGYDEVDVEASDQGRREFASLGGRGVPVILVGAQRMDGFDQAGLAGMLQTAGY
jgi:glutaredoxin